VNKPATPVTTVTPRTRSIAQITVLFLILILSIILLFANFAYLNTQSNYDRQGPGLQAAVGRAQRFRTALGLPARG